MTYLYIISLSVRINYYTIVNVYLFIFLEVNNFDKKGGDLNEMTEDFWDYQEQVFNGLQEINTINNINIVEKRFKSVLFTFMKIMAKILN